MRRFNPVNYLDDEETIAHFLQEAAETGDKEHLANCRASACAARAINKLAQETKIDRKRLCDIIINGGKLTPNAFAKVNTALGVPVAAHA